MALKLMACFPSHNHDQNRNDEIRNERSQCFVDLLFQERSTIAVDIYGKNFSTS